MYDHIMLIAKAVDAEHGSTAPADIVKGLETVSYNGVCGTYQSDSQHNLAHTMYVVQYGATQGQKTKAAEYDNMPSS
jgi:hypothetical protein